MRDKQPDIKKARDNMLWTLALLLVCMFFWTKSDGDTMTKSCHGCLGLTISNAYGPGFCPLGYEVVREGHDKRPKGDCPQPRTQAEMIAIYESAGDDE